VGQSVGLPINRAGNDEAVIMNRMTEKTLSKVPEVTLIFWIIKIAATTLGETGGDAVSMSMNLGYLVGTAIFAAIFIVAVAAQIRRIGFLDELFYGRSYSAEPAEMSISFLLLEKPTVVPGGSAGKRFFEFQASTSASRHTLRDFQLQKLRGLL